MNVTEAKRIIEAASDLNKRGLVYDQIMNEGGEGFNPHQVDQALLRRATDTMFWDNWNVEATRARRADWNRIATARQIKNGRDVIALQEELGFRLENLKLAVAHHGL